MSQTLPFSKTLSVIGCGNMGSALVQGVCASGQLSPSSILVYDVNAPALDRLVSQCNVRRADSFTQAAQAEVIVIALKPQVVREVLGGLRQAIAEAATAPLVISIAAGVTLAELSTLLGENALIVRGMPNTPALIGKGMTAIYGTDAAHVAIAEQLFSQFGRTAVLDAEALLDCATGLAGSGPAFVFTIIEALADGGVKMGLSREVALSMAAYTVEGAAAMVRETGKHPAELRDMVTSPGGTTASGLHQLEKAGVRAGCISAVEAATEKARSGLKKA